jgi:hypothetical protein
MKIPAHCPDCLQTQEGDPKIVAVLEVRDDNCYELVCPCGHQSFKVVQEQKFEILFDIGAYALADGYHREAVSSFTASLERFYEFFIRAAMIERGIPAEQTGRAWKSVSRQSERQLGAFIFLYLSEFKCAPTLMSNNDISFRNNVIHIGSIPTREEALQYGQHVLDIVRPTLRKARDKFPHGIERLILDHIAAGHQQVERGIVTAFLSVPTIIRLALHPDDLHHTKPLAECIKTLRIWRTD